MLVDMHLHECTHSLDSFINLKQIVEIAKFKGLDAVCITDHDSMGLKDYAAEYSKEVGFPIFVGIEFVHFKQCQIIFSQTADVFKFVAVSMRK